MRIVSTSAKIDRMNEIADRIMRSGAFLWGRGMMYKYPSDAARWYMAPFQYVPPDSAEGESPVLHICDVWGNVDPAALGALRYLVRQNHPTLKVTELPPPPSQAHWPQYGVVIVEDKGYRCEYADMAAMCAGELEREGMLTRSIREGLADETDA